MSSYLQDLPEELLDATPTSSIGSGEDFLDDEDVPMSPGAFRVDLPRRHGYHDGVISPIPPANGRQLSELQAGSSEADSADSSVESTGSHRGALVAPHTAQTTQLTRSHTGPPATAAVGGRRGEHEGREPVARNQDGVTSGRTESRWGDDMHHGSRTGSNRLSSSICVGLDLGVGEDTKHRGDGIDTGHVRGGKDRREHNARVPVPVLPLPLARLDVPGETVVEFKAPADLVSPMTARSRAARNRKNRTEAQTDARGTHADYTSTGHGPQTGTTSSSSSSRDGTATARPSAADGSGGVDDSEPYIEDRTLLIRRETVHVEDESTETDVDLDSEDGNGDGDLGAAANAGTNRGGRERGEGEAHFH